MDSLFSIFVVISCLIFKVHNQEVCSRRCEASYPLHTVDKVAELQACTKGCRFELISFLSRTEETCSKDCNEAYRSAPEKKACTQGCEEQKQLNRKPQMFEIEETSDIVFQFRILHPLVSARNYWFGQNNKVAGPSYLVEQSTSDGNGNSFFMRVEMYPWVTAKQTPDNRMQDEVSEKTEEQPSMVRHYVHKIHHKTARWLNCVETKAGVPYATLVAVLFLSLAMVGWICCSTCDESEDNSEKKHRFSKQGLSIMADDLFEDENGNGGKLFTIRMKDEEEEAGPLPVKQKLLQI